MSSSPGARTKSKSQSSAPTSSEKSPVRSREGAERRKFERRKIFESFGISLVLPKLGDHQIEIRDLSEDGIGFCLEEAAVKLLDSARFKSGRPLPVLLYLNRTMHLPLAIEIVRIQRTTSEAGDAVALVGARWAGRDEIGYAALLPFIQLIDKLGPVARFDEMA